MASELKVDTISEKTTASGVTIDGVLLKDGAIASSYISGLTKGLDTAQQWRLTTPITTSGTNTISTNLEIPDTSIQGNLGSLVSMSSGIFSFSETGYYGILINARGTGGSGGYVIIYTQTTNDATNYTVINRVNWEGAGLGLCGSSMSIIDVTDTTNMKVRFQSAIQNNGTISGSTTESMTSFTFFKLGDT